MYSEKSFYRSLIWKEFSKNVSGAGCLEKYVALFGSNSMKVPVFFKVKSEKLSAIVGSNCVKV